MMLILGVGCTGGPLQASTLTLGIVVMPKLPILCVHEKIRIAQKEMFEGKGLSLFTFPVLHVLSPLFNESTTTGSALHTWCSSLLPSYLVSQPVLNFENNVCAYLVHYTYSYVKCVLYTQGSGLWL